MQRNEFVTSSTTKTTTTTTTSDIHLHEFNCSRTNWWMNNEWDTSAALHFRLERQLIHTKILIQYMRRCGMREKYLHGGGGAPTLTNHGARVAGLWLFQIFHFLFHKSATFIFTSSNSSLKIVTERHFWLPENFQKYCEVWWCGTHLSSTVNVRIYFKEIQHSCCLFWLT